MFFGREFLFRDFWVGMLPQTFFGFFWNLLGRDFYSKFVW